MSTIDQYDMLWAFVLMWLGILGGFAGLISLVIWYLGKDYDSDQIQ